MKLRKKILIFLIIAVAFLVCVICFFVCRIPQTEVKIFGVTYSKIQAEDLGLDWQKAYEAIFEDLGFDLIRIPIYWSEVEREEGVFDFSSTDWMMEVAEAHNANVVLVVGRKVPRWPECHEPTWVQSQISKIKSQKLLDYIKTTVKRYDDSFAVWAWQVENEPFLNFGECPGLDKEFLDGEIKLVKSLSSKPIIITDGGEFGDWARAYKRADIFGTTMYRTIWNDTIGYFKYPIPPSFFRLKLGIIDFIYGKKPSVVIELQAEPWGPMLIQDLDINEQFVSMNPEKFKELMEYIEGTGFDTFYLWGVEWWYWLKENGHPEMWELVKSTINK